LNDQLNCKLADFTASPNHCKSFSMMALNAEPPANLAFSPTVKRFEEKIRCVASSEQGILTLRLAAKMGRDRLFTLFVWMLVESGARKSELLQRTWQDLDIAGDIGSLHRC